MQDLIACGGVGHELGDVVGDDLPRDAPPVDAPAAALGLGHGREPRPVAVDLFLVSAETMMETPGVKVKPWMLTVAAIPGA